VQGVRRRSCRLLYSQTWVLSRGSGGEARLISNLTYKTDRFVHLQYLKPDQIVHSFTANISGEVK